MRGILMDNDKESFGGVMSSPDVPGYFMESTTLHHKE
jgi:hypothetical protein